MARATGCAHRACANSSQFSVAVLSRFALILGSFSFCVHHDNQVEYYSVALAAMLHDWRAKKGDEFPLGTMQVRNAIID